MSSPSMPPPVGDISPSPGWALIWLDEPLATADEGTVMAGRHLDSSRGGRVLLAADGACYLLPGYPERLVLIRWEDIAAELLP